MTAFLLLAIALTAQPLETPALCAGFDSEIAEDRRILESDLTQAAAAKAAEKLRIMIERGEVTGEFMHGALNQAKVIHGHILGRHARESLEAFGQESIEHAEAKTAFCSWLVTEGFWYD